ncbi:MAG: Stp1/IreP family PP2C-type Ser/Thr phosphatase [Candidatus Sericytochromatia bacterium]|nr:Stp1/IreP family PP2C-type Ser/Thr phosphatase [Candidatus Sericytochromatia bacterium]
MRIFGITDKGIVRETNQDSFATEPRLGLMIVADGMGGHAAGEQASSSAVMTVLEVFSRYDFAKGTLGGSEETYTVDQIIALALQEANERIMIASVSDASLQGMGTTAIVAVQRDQALHIGHIGDSRVYRVRSGQVDQLTEDHSIVQQLVRAGAISPAEAQVHPYKNVITRCLGMASEIEPDLFKVAFEAEDRFVICSDGMSNFVSNQRLTEIVGGCDDIEEAGRMLISEANARGGADNITVVLMFADATRSQI